MAALGLIAMLNGKNCLAVQSVSLVNSTQDGSAIRYNNT